MNVSSFLSSATIIVLFACLSSCNGRKTDGASVGVSDSLFLEDLNDINEDALSRMTEGTISKAEDGRLWVEAGILSGGGSTPDYFSLCYYLNAAGDTCAVMLSTESYYSDVHAVKCDNGTTLYLMQRYERESSAIADACIEAYVVVGDDLKRVKTLKGGDSDARGDFSVAYSLPAIEDITHGAGFDWMLHYDTASRNLYVPLTSDYEPTDHYEVWHFTGRKFEPSGETAHPGLYKPLCDYVALRTYFTTSDYTVRVDSLTDRQLRLAVWKKPKTMADAPDILINGGRRQQYPLKSDHDFKQSDDFRFTRADTTIVAALEEIKCIDEGIGESHEYFLIKKGAAVVLKQEVVQ